MPGGLGRGSRQGCRGNGELATGESTRGVMRAEEERAARRAGKTVTCCVTGRPGSGSPKREQSHPAGPTLCHGLIATTPHTVKPNTPRLSRPAIGHLLPGQRTLEEECGGGTSMIRSRCLTIGVHEQHPRPSAAHPIPPYTSPARYRCMLPGVQDDRASLNLSLHR